MNILLTVSYDGTNYCGWQIQKNGVAVQEKLEQAVEKIYGRHIRVTGCSRTDAGVHALRQGACIIVPDIIVPVWKLPYVLNNLLPDDIVVTEARLMHEEFHPRFDAKEKTYIYKILNTRYINPFTRNTCWHMRHKIDIDPMKDAARHLIGTHDFKAFAAFDPYYTSTTVRTLIGIDITKESGIIEIKVTGDGFLYNMVRIISGTLVDVGRGKMKPDDIPGILESNDRTKAGMTAPPHGLVLFDVKYNEDCS